MKQLESSHVHKIQTFCLFINVFVILSLELRCYVEKIRLKSERSERCKDLEISGQKTPSNVAQHKITKTQMELLSREKDWGTDTVTDKVLRN